MYRAAFHPQTDKKLSRISISRTQSNRSKKMCAPSSSKLNECIIFESLPRFEGKAYRVDYGLPYGRGVTAYDVIRYEERELGNNNNVPRSILAALKKIPAPGIVWVTKNIEDAKVYGANVQEVSLDEGSRIIGEDGDGGYLVLKGRYLSNLLIR
jgi:hypothetical protein